MNRGYLVQPLQASTVASALDRASRAWPDRPFLSVLPRVSKLWGIEAQEVSFHQLYNLAIELLLAYAAAGYGHGHRVGLVLDNRPSFFVHWFALNGLGVSVVPISSELRSLELEYCIGHSELILLVAPAVRHSELRAAAQAAGRTVAVMEDGQMPPVASTEAPRKKESIGENSECALLYTSGTTGKPKGCLLSNRYFLHAGIWYGNVGGLVSLRPCQERMLTPLPLVHMNAMAYSTMAMLGTGGCLIMLDRFHPSTWWDDVREARATIVHYLGVMPAVLMKAPASPLDRAHTVRVGFGAGVDKTLHAAFEDRFGFPLLEAWAMTETGAGAVVMAHQEPRAVGSNCFGQEGPDVQIRLVADDGSEAQPGEPAELLVRHTGVDPRFGFFSGYLKDHEETEKAWADGWFHTGDIVTRDASGLLHFIDRRKNVIRRAGENISAVEVEGVLNEHPLVQASAVAATADPLRGEEVLACVVLKQAIDETQHLAVATEIVNHVLQRLSYFKAPGYVAFVDALPLTTSQKIQRGTLKTWAAALPNEKSCVDIRSLKRRRSQ